MIEQSYQEVRSYLKNIPDAVAIYFDDVGIVIPETGVGGFAYSRVVMTQAIQYDFPDKPKQQAERRATIFYESFHLTQRFLIAYATIEIW